MKKDKNSLTIFKRAILILVAASFSLQAELYVIAKAGRDRSSLTPYVKEVKQQLSSFPDAKVKILRSKHPEWKWRLGIVNIKDRSEADAILARIKDNYFDAYLLNAPSYSANLNNLKKKSLYHKPKHKRKKYPRNRKKDRTVDINFTDLSITEFIKMVSKITGKNILISEKVEGNVDFVGTKPIKESKLLTLLNQILFSKKLTLVDSNDGYLKVVKSTEAVTSGPPLASGSKIDQIQTEIIPLKTIKPIDIIKQAKSLVSKFGKMSASNDTNSIIITDYPQNINAIKEIVNILNSQGGHDKIIKFIQFSHVDVDTIFSKVAQMTRAYFNTYAKSQQPKIIQSPSANSIIVVGNRDIIQKIISPIKAFDQASDKKDKDVEMVLIKNTDAAQISKLLSSLISDEDFNQNIEHMSGENSISKKKLDKKGVNVIAKSYVEQKNRYKNRTKSAKITYDKQLNAVMIFGTEKEREVLKKIIRELDTERKQVYVKARILEINDQKASQIGMQYGIVGGVSNSSGLYALSSKLGLNDPQTGVSLAKGLNLALPNASKVVALGAAISLLSENSAADIISEPSILCINNEESSIYVGKTISVVSQSSVASTTTDINRNTYSREDIGLTLNILPRISSDNKVTLGIKIISEDILPGSVVGLPKTTKRVVKTSAIVKNGESVIIGGMAREKESKNKNGIPILKNLPLLGKLFAREDVTRERTTLVLVLTPYIVNHSTDLSKLKEELGRLYSFEKNYVHNMSSI